MVESFFRDNLIDKPLTGIPSVHRYNTCRNHWNLLVVLWMDGNGIHDDDQRCYTVSLLEITIDGCRINQTKK